MRLTRPISASLALLALGYMVGPIPVQTVRAMAPNSPRYRLIDIGALAPHLYSYAVGINRRGDVIGQAGSTSFTPFLYRDGRLAWLIPPKGIVNPLATGINDEDVVSVQAQDGKGNAAVFAVKPKGSGFVWIRLSLGVLAGINTSVSAVARSGAIDGTFSQTLPNGNVELRSIIWKPVSHNAYFPAGSYAETGGYQAASLLPMGEGYTASTAGGVWSHNGRLYVAGAEGGSQGQEATIWSPSLRSAGLPGQLPFASVMGGTNQHLFAGGTTWTPQSSRAWASPVHFNRKGVASIGRITLLRRIHGYHLGVGSGVTVHGGQAIVVGDLIDSNDFAKIRAVEWRKRSPILLQSTLARASGWTLTQAAGINRGLQIAGQGVIHGHYRALLLTPIP